MGIWLTILAAYLAWCIPQYIFHRVIHFMITSHYEHILSIGELNHHKLGKNFFYDVESDPELKWINVSRNIVWPFITIMAIVLSVLFSVYIGILFFFAALFFSMGDLLIHERVHMGKTDCISRLVRYLHTIHHKKWKHNYAIFFGIPLDFMCFSLRLK